MGAFSSSTTIGITLTGTVQNPGVIDGWVLTSSDAAYALSAINVSPFSPLSSSHDSGQVEATKTHSDG